MGCVPGHRAIFQFDFDDSIGLAMSIPAICEKFPDTLAKLREDKAILGLLLVGSYARGDETPESDVDLLALSRIEDWEEIRKEGDFLLDIRVISQTSLEAMLATNTAMVLSLWEDAVILDDPHEELLRTQEEITAYNRRGAPRPSSERQAHTRHQAEHLLGSIRGSNRDAPADRQYLIFQLTELLVQSHFEQAGQWLPPVKTRLLELKKSHPARAQMLSRALAGSSPEEKMSALAHLIDDLFPQTETVSPSIAKSNTRTAQTPVTRRSIRR